MTAGEIAATILSVLSVLVAVVSLVLYLRGRRRKEPCWATRTNNLVRDYTAKLSALDVKYSGRSVQNLSITRVVFWNKGGETIHAADIATADPLRITPTAAVTILDVIIVQVDNEASQFRLSSHEEGTTVALRFAYLDRGNGAVIDVVHTGTSSDDISVEGSVMGAGHPAKRAVQLMSAFDPLASAERRRSVPSRTRGLLFFLAPPVVMLFVSASLWVTMLRGEASRADLAMASIMSGSALITMAGAVGLIMLAQPVPKGLKAFEADI